MTGGFDPPLTDGSVSEESTLQLLLAHERNRELLADWLDDGYDVVVDSPSGLHQSDLCLVDDEGFLANRETIQSWKEENHPRFSPVILVTEQQVSEDLEPEAWADIDGLYVVDEVVSLPAEKSVLGRRLENLLERRFLSDRLARQYERSEQRFASLFHATPDPAVVLDENAEMQYVNDAFCSTVGLKRETVIGESLEALSTFDAATIGQLQDAASRTMAGDPVDDFSLVYETADGLRHAELSIRDTTVGDRTGAVLVFHDVTERVQREQELAQSEQRFQEIASHVNEIIWMVSPDASELIYMSPGIVDLIGQTPAELEDDPVSPFLERAHEDDTDKVDAWVADSIADVATGAENAPYSTEFRLNSPTGVRWVELDGYPVFDEDGDVERLVGVIDDITDTKARELELAQQNERLEEFASIVSHDLRNPLQIIKSRAEMVDSSDADHVDSIRKATDRMEDLIADLLEIARHGETVEDIELLDVGTVAAEAWDLVETGSATLTVDADATVEADPDRLQQLFENLFRNAVEHGSTDPDSQARQDAVEHGSTGNRNSQSSGDVAEETSAGHRTESDDAVEHGDRDDASAPTVSVRVGLLYDDGQPDGFYVEDDGPGIPVDQRDHLFEYGTAGSDGGMGLGLAIVEDIVDAHGWRIRVADGADRSGARFEVTGVTVREQ